MENMQIDSSDDDDTRAGGKSIGPSTNSDADPHQIRSAFNVMTEIAPKSYRHSFSRAGEASIQFPTHSESSVNVLGGTVNSGEADRTAALVVEPLEVFCGAIKHNCSSLLVEESRTIRFVDFNCEIPADAPIGCFNRRGEEYTVGDFWLLYFSPRDDYKFANILAQNFRYINVIERPAILSYLQGGSGCLPSSAVEFGNPTTTWDPNTAVSTITPLPRRAIASLLDPSIPIQPYFGDHFRNSNSLIDTVISRLSALPLGKGSTSPLRRSSHSNRGILPTRLTDYINEKGQIHDKAFQALSVPTQSCHSDTSVWRGNFLCACHLADVVFAKHGLRSTPQPLKKGTSPRGAAANGAHSSARGRFAHPYQTTNGTTSRRHQKPTASGDKTPPERSQVPNASDYALSTSGNVVTSPSSRSLTLLEEIIKKRNLRPIIVVPSENSSSLINIKNVFDFLNAGNFLESTSIPPTIASSSVAAAKSDVCRVIGGKKIKFRLFDNSLVGKLTDLQWPAVVAAVASGAEWQFTKWPFPNEREMFKYVKVYHFAYQDSKLLNSVVNGKCHVLRLHRTLKHYHASVQNEFWSSIETFLLSKRSEPFQLMLSNQNEKKHA